MRKSWLMTSVAAGLIGLVLAVVILNVTYGSADAQSRLFDRLYLDGGAVASIPCDQYDASNGLFFLGMAGVLLVEFACGTFAFLGTHTPGDRAENTLKASVVAGVLPALAPGFFELGGWYDYVPVRPSEPTPFVIAIALVAAMMIVCVAAAVAGGYLAGRLGAKAESR